MARFNRTAAVMKLIREYTDRGTLYIAGPNCDFNSTELVEYKVIWTGLSEKVKHDICHRAVREIPDVVRADLTKHKNQNIRICFETRANGQHPIRYQETINRRSHRQYLR